MHIKKMLITLTGLVGLSACGGQQQDNLESIPSVKYISATVKDAKQIRGFSGKIESSSQAELSFGVSGKVTRILVNEGDDVFAGQLLAELDKKTYQLSLDSALSKLKASRASLTEAEREFKRQQELIKRKLVAVTALDSAKNKFKNAQSQVVVEEKNVEKAKSDLEKTQIKAPFSGKISKKLLRKHAEVSPNTGIIQIQSSENHQVSVLIPESMIQFVQYNQNVKIILSTDKKVTLEGYVSEIAAKTEAGNAFEVTAIVKGGEATIRPGMTAEVSFEFYTSAQQTAFPIPISALSTKDAAEHEYKKDDQPSIPLYVIDDATSTAQLKWVDTIGASGNELYVVSGLSEGDKVIVAGVAFLHDGMKVIPWKP